MSVETYSTNPRELIDTITVSDAALEHFRRLLKKNAKKGVRISLKEAGCTGFKYVIEEVDNPHDGDTTRKLADDVELYVETGCLAAIKGLSIDLTQMGLNKNLVMNNPNVKDECGCGESFSV
ncbi:iron-sulfur cluster assembly accessory protein [Saccharophagus sp. K07]|jgi:iron-sulfur cluster assembly protein|uniref:HesB/IscA family protein n=1 Tax=Saccharophagus sp. K07 TaxID=2283636 RepID=UPI001651FB06|nr:iron-sulfur cluster assembly accessory protein [Saccharophagus sp. K07]MBC6905721.1 iron-sulfur cluster assembly accessory protein [Saccharophagus sp. K07]